MSTDYKFAGWLAFDKTSADGNMKWQEFEPKQWEETDVDIKITHCGVCGSDLHTLSAGWGDALWPICVGHEIVGTIVRAGSQAHGGLKVGDRVGVGAQSLSCLKGDCAQCSDGHENYCQNAFTQTYNQMYPNGKDKTMGGYADYWRGPSHFVIKIPDAIPSESAAPMLCGGVTAFTPMTYNNVGPGKSVGIIGVGGLGHFGIMGAKALGADKIYAISRTSAKKDDALKMGATDFIATDEDKDWATKHSTTLDVIVSTVSSPKMPLPDYLKLLKVRGAFVQIGAPEDNIPPFNAFSLLSITIGGSAIGSPEDIRQMLQLFAEKGVRTWNNNYPMEKANEAMVAFNEGKPRYRIVLVNEKHL